MQFFYLRADPAHTHGRFAYYRCFYRFGKRRQRRIAGDPNLNRRCETAFAVSHRTAAQNAA